MTEIAFHFNVRDRLAYSCRLLRKAYFSGANVVVTAGPEVLAELDQLLWSFSPTEFVPHCLAGAAENSKGAASVLLAESFTGCMHYDVLVNLGQRIPVGFERFERLIDVVTQADDDRVSARSRWKHYTDRGYTMKQHDLAIIQEDT